MKLQIRQKFAFGFAALALVTSANAAVTFAGSVSNTGNAISNWSSTATSKTLDLDGNNFYGSDGYAWINNNNDGAAVGVEIALTQAAPSYTSDIFYTGTVGIPNFSGSSSAAQDRLNPDGTGLSNVGYGGINYGTATGATTLQSLFTYTMNRNMSTGETIRVGVVLDNLNLDILGADSLTLSAGGVAAASGLNRDGIMDIFFFDVTGLVSGDKIEILAAKATDANDFGINGITIGGVTFDSVPEPSSALLGGLGLLAMLRRRR